MKKVSERFLSLYNPHCENSMDEAKLCFEERSSLKPYMPANAVERGIKVWCRTDAHNGYLCEYEVYTGRSEGVQDGLGKRVVLGLPQKLEGLRYHTISSPLSPSSLHSWIRVSMLVGQPDRPTRTSLQA